MAADPAPTAARRYDRRAVWAWCLYDWANQPLNTVIITFVYAVYLTGTVAVGDLEGAAADRAEALAASRLAAYNAAGAVAAAILCPLLGTIADRTGRRRPSLIVATVVCAGLIAALFAIEPDPSHLLAGLVLLMLAELTGELAGVAYNAQLLDVAPRTMVGRVSGWGWGLGYYGGLVSLLLCLGLVLAPDAVGLPTRDALNVRAVALVSAGWYLLFAIPAFLFVPDRPSQVGVGQALREGGTTLVAGARRIAAVPGALRYLIASAVYRDGLNAVFAFGGVFAAGAFGLSTAQVIAFGILLTIAAGTGSFLFSAVDDRWGPKRVVVVSICGLLVTGVPLLLTRSTTLFWLLAGGLSLFVGPIQSASRSLMARFLPDGEVGEGFGLYATVGRIANPIGSTVFAVLAGAFASQRAGMAGVVGIIAVGLLLLLAVPEPAATAVAGAEDDVARPPA